MSRVLVPFELPDAAALSQTLVDELASVEVVLLGHYNLPEQTPSRAASEQFGDDATAEMDEIAAQFQEAGADVTRRVVFGKDRDAAIEEVATEEGCVAELIPAETDNMDQILVPIPDADIDRLPEFVRLMYNDLTQEITLLHVADDDDAVERGTQRLAEARTQLVEAGFDPGLIDSTLLEGGDHDSEIKATAAEYDAVVMYEANSRLRDFMFGSLPDQIANETDDPVLVVQRDYES
ncbi:MAG: universal stress protein UspA related nucleotide-binding protein [halophilic archaeon J07HX5]|jgi:Universal stress protein family.|nr:MAG: universal stress protein UspA related nucleotide-binding protein [halophilic archaeon J07HX5]